MSATDVPDLSGVTDMSNMFSGASAFNGDISDWNTSSVIYMEGVFSSASAFNQPIGSWNTGNVISMRYLFASASAFNQDISTWNTGNVTDMQEMFSGAIAFDQNIGEWNVGALTSANEMFASGATLSTANYDALLIGWDAQALNPSVAFGGGNSKYCAGAAARGQMISSDGWTINDGGEEPTCSTPSTTINDHTGAPGSFFNITGANYPANVQTDISVNGVDVGTAVINANGNLSVTLETAPTSDEGIYQVAVTVESQPEPSDTVLYELDASEPEREQEGSLPVQSVPEEIAPFLPQLDINYPTGAPGSFFKITGTDYPVNVETDISVNGVDVGTVEIDANGSFSVTLQTSTASEEGTYKVEVTLEGQPNPSGDVQYELDVSAPEREKEGGLPVLPVPEEIAPAPLKFIYLPLVIR
jgi:surface protein